jgi:hypothetical protein
MAANKRHDYRISFADGRIVEITNCANPGLARLRASIYHPAGAIVKAEKLGAVAVRRANPAVRNRAGRFLTEKTDSDMPDAARRGRAALRGGEREMTDPSSPHRMSGGHRPNRQSQCPATSIVRIGPN